MGAIDYVAPMKKVRMKLNSNLWFDAVINLAIQKRDKLHSSCKKSILETDKDNLKTTKIFLQKMLNERQFLFRGKTSSKLKKPKEFWKTLISLG